MVPTARGLNGSSDAIAQAARTCADDHARALVLAPRARAVRLARPHLRSGPLVGEAGPHLRSGPLVLAPRARAVRLARPRALRRAAGGGACVRAATRVGVAVRVDKSTFAGQLAQASSGALRRMRKVTCQRGPSQMWSIGNPTARDLKLQHLVRGETCPVSTEGGTRRVQLVREGGGRGGPSPASGPARPRKPAPRPAPLSAQRGKRLQRQHLVPPRSPPFLPLPSLPPASAPKEENGSNGSTSFSARHGRRRQRNGSKGGASAPPAPPSATSMAIRWRRTQRNAPRRTCAPPPLVLSGHAASLTPY